MQVYQVERVPLEQRGPVDIMVLSETRAILEKQDIQDTLAHKETEDLQELQVLSDQPDFLDQLVRSILC